MNILIIRLSAIGDIIFTSYLISAIKNTYPDAKISWLAEPAPAKILINHPLLENIFIWDKKHWYDLLKQGKIIALWREIQKLKQRFKAENFDWVIDAQGLLKSALLAQLAHAKRKISLGGLEASRFIMTEVYSRDIGNKEEIASEYKGLAYALGLKTGEMCIIPDQSYTFNLDNTIVLCPFTTRAQKHWIDQHWQSLIQVLSKDYNLVILGGPSDNDHAEKIIGQYTVINKVGQTSLLQAAQIIQKARLVIGVDTGLTHLGYALKTPTIALFGSTRPYTNPNAVGDVLYHAMPCAPCKRNPSCNNKFTCMLELSPENVIYCIQKYL